jgi:hypothetical protein
LALMNHIHRWLGSLANGEQALEQLEECRPVQGGRAGLVRRGRSNTRSWSYGRPRAVLLLWAKRGVLHILDKGTLGDCLNQSHDVRSISTRASVGDSNVPHLLKNEIKCIELGLLGDGLEQISLKLRHPRAITLSRCQSLPNDPVKDNQLRLEVGDGGSMEVGGLINGSHLIEC